MKDTKKRSKKPAAECKPEPQPMTCCRMVSYCDCCGCYDYSYCC